MVEQEVTYLIEQSWIQPFTYLAFPDLANAPAKYTELQHYLAITLDIALKLCVPEFGIARRCRRLVAAMAMPEAALDLYDCPMLGKHEVGLAWQFRCMKSIAEAPCVSGLSQH